MIDVAERYDAHFLPNLNKIEPCMLRYSKKTGQCWTPDLLLEQSVFLVEKLAMSNETVKLQHQCFPQIILVQRRNPIFVTITIVLRNQIV